MLDGQTSFLSGYNYGAQSHAVELTAREISQTRADMVVESFAQGMLDGLAGDRFRVDLMLGSRG